MEQRTRPAMLLSHKNNNATFRLQGASRLVWAAIPNIHSTHPNRCPNRMYMLSPGQRLTGSIPQPATVQDTFRTLIHLPRSTTFPKPMLENPLTPRALDRSSSKRSLTAQLYTPKMLQVLARGCTGFPSPVLQLAPLRLLLQGTTTAMTRTEVFHQGVRSSRHTTALISQSLRCPHH